MQVEKIENSTIPLTENFSVILSIPRSLSSSVAVSFLFPSMPKTKTESDVSAATTLPSFDRGNYPHWSGLEHGIQPGKFYDACLSSCCCLLFLDVSRYFIFTCSLTFFCRLCDTDGRREVEGNASVSQHVF